MSRWALQTLWTVNLIAGTAISPVSTLYIKAATDTIQPKSPFTATPASSQDPRKADAQIVHGVLLHASWRVLRVLVTRGLREVFINMKDEIFKPAREDVLRTA